MCNFHFHTTQLESVSTVCELPAVVAICRAVDTSVMMVCVGSTLWRMMMLTTKQQEKQISTREVCTNKISQMHPPPTYPS